MLASAESKSKHFPIALPLGSRRDLDYYLDCGRYYREQRDLRSREEWNLYKREQGNFLDKCLTILDNWDKLPEKVRESLSRLKYPDYLTASSVIALLKVPAEIMGECVERLKSFLGETGSLASKDIEKIARLFHFQRKSYLIIEEVVTARDWELISRKYRPLKNPARLEELQEEARRLAGDSPIFTEHVVEALSNLGHDPSSILPKPKKKYSDRDLKAATAPLERERDSLKSENETLKRLLERAGISLPDTSGNNDNGEERENKSRATSNSEKDEKITTDSLTTGLQGENPLSSPANNGDPSGTDTRNSPTRESVPTLGRTVPLAGRGDSPVAERKEIIGDLTLDDLKNRAARTRIGRVLTVGKIIDHNGSPRVWRFRVETGEKTKTLFLKAEAIEVESPPDSGEYRSLSEFLAEIGINAGSPPIAVKEKPKKRVKVLGFGKT